MPRTMLTAPARRRRDPGCRPDGRWRAAAGLACRPGYAAFALDLLARIIAARIDAGPPFSRSSRSDCRSHRRSGWQLCPPPPTLHIQCVMDVLERAVVIRARQVIVHRALRRQILGQIAPLAAVPDIHHAVDHLAHHHRRRRPPGLAGGISGPMSAHSRSVRSDG